MRDVAAEAGVSFKTVSRVVNAEGGVSPELVTRVEAAITALGYRPDQRARGLRQTSSAPTTIGFVQADVSNNFFSAALRGIEDVADGHGCLVLAGSTEGSETRERNLIEALVGRRVSGLIVVPSRGAAESLKLEIQRGTPVVFLDLDPEIPDLDTDLVRSDHQAGAAAAVRHLLDRGHTDIAYFGDDPAIYSARLRLEGYRQAMTEAGLSLDPDRITTGSHPDRVWTDLIHAYFDEHAHPTAIFTAQNFITVGAVRALHDLGLRSTIAHVGFDDFDLAEALTPAVTVVPQNPRELGRLAAEQLFARLDDDTVKPRQQIITSGVIERGSGEIPPPR